jgi:hypothetical protein
VLPGSKIVLGVVVVYLLVPRVRGLVPLPA